MKLDCGPTKDERKAAREEKRKAKEAARRQWHRVFAWWPTRIGSHDCRWLEMVERRWTKVGERWPPYSLVWSQPYDVFGWEYRACL